MYIHKSILAKQIKRHQFKELTVSHTRHQKKLNYHTKTKRKQNDRQEPKSPISL